MMRVSLVVMFILLILPHQFPFALVTPADAETLPVITAANMDLVQRYAVLGHGGGMHAKFAWSPDGKTLAVVALGGVWIYELDDLENPHLLIESDKIVTGKLDIHADEAIYETSGWKIAFSSSGDYLATASPHETVIRLWDSATWQEIKVLEGMGTSPATLTISPDGKYLAASETMIYHKTSESTWGSTEGLEGSRAFLWDVASGEATEVFQQEKAPIRYLAFNPTSQYLAIYNYDGWTSPLRIWNVMENELQLDWVNPEAFGIGGNIEFVSDTVLVFSTGYSLGFFDVAKGTFEREIDKADWDYFWVNPIDISNDYQLLATVSDKMSVAIGEISTGTYRFTHRYNWYSLTQIMFSPDTTLLAVAQAGGNLSLLDTQTGWERFLLPNHIEPITQVGFNADGTVLASADTNGWVVLWAVGQTPVHPSTVSPTHDDLTQLAPITAQNISQLQLIDVLGRGEITHIEWSPGGEILGMSSESGIWLYDGEKIDQTIAVLGEGYRFNEFAFSLDGKWIAGAGNDGAIWLWDAKTYALHDTWWRHSSPVMSLAFSDDSSLLVSGGTFPDGMVRAWEVNTRQEIVQFRMMQEQANSIDISPDNKIIAVADSPPEIFSASAGLITLYDIPNQKTLGIVACSYGTASKVLFDNHSGQLFAGTGHYYLLDLTLAKISPFGRTVFCGDEDIPSGAGVINLIEGNYYSHLPDAAFSSDDNYLAMVAHSGSEFHNLVQIWDIEAGAYLEVYTSEEEISNIAIHPQNNHLAIVTLNSDIQLLDPFTQTILDKQNFHFPSKYTNFLAISSDTELAVGTIIDEYVEADIQVWDLLAHSSTFVSPEADEWWQPSFKNFSFNFGLSPDRHYRANNVAHDDARICVDFPFCVIEIIDEQTETPIKRIYATRDDSNSLNFSPDNMLLLATNDFDWRVINWQTDEELFILPQGATAAQFSPDGTFIATANNGVIRIWGVPAE